VITSVTKDTQSPMLTHWGPRPAFKLT